MNDSWSTNRIALEKQFNFFNLTESQDKFRSRISSLVVNCPEPENYLSTQQQYQQEGQEIEFNSSETNISPSNSLYLSNISNEPNRSKSYVSSYASTPNWRNHSSTHNNSFFPKIAKSCPTTPLRASGQKVRTPNRRLEDPIDGYIYQVQFKRAHKNFILSPSAPLNIIPGDFVKVEADRGEDMGVVLSKIHQKDFEEVVPTAGYRGRGFSSGQGEKKYLYRLATQEEKKSLKIKVEDEEQALEVITKSSELKFIV